VLARRQFLEQAGLGLLGLAWSGFQPGRLQGAAAPFPVHYRRASPYDAILSHVQPGRDEFPEEAAALELEQRLARVFQGKEALPEGLKQWAGQLGNIRSARFYVLPANRVRYELSIRNTAGLSYHTGLWSLPDLTEISGQVTRAGSPLFRDVTGYAFSQTSSFRNQLLKGNPWWRANLDSAAGIDVYGNQGIAVGDIDSDGRDEIYVCQPGGLPNRLYRFDESGQLSDITDHAGVGVLDDTNCALFVDFRNSGHQDLVVLRAAGPLFFRNRGDGTFTEQPDAFRFKTRPQGSFTGMAAADYDRDGRVDLYLCCYVYFQSEDQYQYPAPYHDARNGPPNFLFHNRLQSEGGAFEDVTTEVGLNENNDRFSFSPAWCDTNGDGWPDLYIANDFGRNNLYRNHGGKFRDEAAKAGVEDIGPGMSASWFDYDADGKPDLYVSNMWTAAGQRVTAMEAFHPAAKLKDEYRRHTKGNSLYRNRGDGTFEERGAEEGVEMGRWAWSSGAFDFDHDGTPEIFSTAGMVTNGPGTDLNSFFWRQTVAKSPVTQRTVAAYENGWNAINQLIRQDASWCGGEPNVFYVRKDGRYQDWSGVSGLDFADDSRAFAVTDFDSDGNLDVILKSRLAPQVRVLQNNCGVGKPAISIRLRGTKSNADAIGARVEVNGRVQWVQAGGGFLSQHSKCLNFALGDKKTAHVRVAWPSGETAEFTNLEPGHRYHLREGSEEAAKTPYRARAQFPDVPVTPLNAPEASNTWLLQPVPLPDLARRSTSGFLLLHAGRKPDVPPQVTAIDLAAEPEEVAAAYSLLRKYLFEYRAELQLPLMLLVDEQNRVHKVYATPPGAEAMRADLNQLSRSAELALPFAGRYYSEPRRNFFKLGAAFYWAGYPERALPFLQEVVRTHPENWKAAVAIGRIQQETGRHREALATFEDILKARPQNAPVLINAAEVSAALEDKAASLAFLKRAIAADAENADAANQLGVLAAAEDHYDEARSWFERAIAAQRNHAGAINNLGVLYAKAGKMSEAVAAFRYGIQAAPEDEQLYMNLGRVYLASNQREQARAVLVQLLERKPGSTVAANALAELEAR